MKLALVTYTNAYNHPGHITLIRSAQRWGWELFSFGAGTRWEGFKSKFRGVKAGIPNLRDLGYTHMVFVDAHDVLIAGPPSQFDPLESSAGIVWGCERACWPPPVDATRYPKEAKSSWKFLNSGQYFGSIDQVDGFLNDSALNCEDDQWEASNRFLDDLESGSPKMRLDDGCEYFQTLAHVVAWDWQKWEDTFETVVDGGSVRFRNKETGTIPAILHGNGTTGVKWFADQTGD